MNIIIQKYQATISETSRKYLKLVTFHYTVKYMTNISAIMPCLLINYFTLKELKRSYIHLQMYRTVHSHCVTAQPANNHHHAVSSYAMLL